MSQAWIAASAAAEANALQKQTAEDVAHERFRAVRAQIEAAGSVAQAVDTPEFNCWMAARQETDEAWGAWAMVMDTKPAS